MKKFVIYSRQSKVSDYKGQMTLETSDSIIRHFLNTQGEEGVDYEIMGAFKEVTSSFGAKSSSRINFNKAYEMCKQNNYTLVVSTAARLARNTAFGSKVIEDIDVIFASHPTASKTMKNIMIVLAEDESINQSERRKATCDAKRERCKRNGEKFVWGGNSTKWRETFEQNKASGKHKYHTNERQFKVNPETDSIRKEIERVVKITQVNSYKELTEKVQLASITTPTGKMFTQQNLTNFCRRNNINL